MNLNFKVLGSDIQNNKTTIGKQNLAIKPRIKENYQREGRILLLRCSVNPTPKGGANVQEKSIGYRIYIFLEEVRDLAERSEPVPVAGKIVDYDITALAGLNLKIFKFDKCKSF